METGKLIEEWVGCQILWLACRHHVYELHLKHAFIEIFGVTKDPGVSLFRRLKSEWNSITVDYDNLSVLDLGSLPEWVQKEGSEVLDWAIKELENNTFPREDYKELLLLTIKSLGRLQRVDYLFKKRSAKMCS